MNNIYDIIIVGAGPAGMTAALYALRSDKKVLIIEKETCGGQIALAPKVENYMTRNSISGIELADKMFEQIMDLGVEFELENVEKIDKVEDLFHITTDYNKYLAKSVILAMGVKQRKIGVLNEDKWIGSGISYCVACDGAFYKGKDIAVIGDGNSALQYALELSSYCPKVYVCTLFDKFFGDDVLVNRLKSRDNIEIIHNVSLQQFKFNDELEGLVFKNTKDDSIVELDVKGCFIAIGQIPKNDIFSNLVELDKNGYILVDSDLQSKTEGLFVAGDCRQKKVRQLTTAVSDGAMASVGAVSYIDKNFE